MLVIGAWGNTVNPGAKLKSYRRWKVFVDKLTGGGAGYSGARVATAGPSAPYVSVDEYFKRMLQAA